MYGGNFSELRFVLSIDPEVFRYNILLKILLLRRNFNGFWLVLGYAVVRSPGGCLLKAQESYS
uniref:Uncharacterized protein n=1 Tax=Lotus japonicus TaxID=34305 RepID=I3S1E1_LOTJA|nr:unknown [Lotus japonicus]